MSLAKVTISQSHVSTGPFICESVVDSLEQIKILVARRFGIVHRPFRSRKGHFCKAELHHNLRVSLQTTKRIRRETKYMQPHKAKQRATCPFVHCTHLCALHASSNCILSCILVCQVHWQTKVAQSVSFQQSTPLEDCRSWQKRAAASHRHWL